MVDHNIEHIAPDDKSELQPQTKGAISELLACTFLMCRGYQVFRNVSPRGSIDIVAVRGKEIRKFDIKTAVFRENGFIANMMRNKTQEQEKEGIEILHVDHKGQCYFEHEVIRGIQSKKDILYFNQKEREKKIIASLADKKYNCKNCQKEFTRLDIPSRRSYCSDECQRECRNKKITLKTKQCISCGKTYTGNARNIYCSRECYSKNPTLNGHKSLHSEKPNPYEIWDEIRKKFIYKSPLSNQ